MAKKMEVVVEADLKTFVTEMNKADRAIKNTSQTVKDSSGAVKGLASSFNTLTGGAIPGLDKLASTMGAAKQMSVALGQSWNVLKTTNFATPIASMAGLTTTTVAADGATKALTVSTAAFQATATLGLTAVIAGVVQLVSWMQRENEELKRIEEKRAKLHQQNLSNAETEQKKSLALIESQLTQEEKRIAREKEYAEAIKKRIENEKLYKNIVREIDNIRNFGSGQSIGNLVNQKNELLAEMSGYSLDDLKASQQRMLDEYAKADQQRIAALNEAAQKENQSRLATAKQIMEMTLTNDERTLNNLNDKLQEIKTLQAEGSANILDVMKFEQHILQIKDDMLEKELSEWKNIIKTSDDFMNEKLARFEKVADKFEQKDRDAIRNKIREEFIKPQKPNDVFSTNLSAMEHGGIAAYQTINQRNDPNTQLLSELLNAQVASNKTMQDVSNNTRSMSETLQSAS